ncbi:MAG: phosphate signaling complex protein PhoU, partial [Maritimibacter sp.]
MNSDQHHIASAFDRDLEDIQALVMKMGGLVEDSIKQGAKALKSRDTELAEKVRHADKRIDELEEQINLDCARVIALRQPIAGDLRTVLTVIKISSNLERIGDYAKNMAKRTTVLAEIGPVNSAPIAIRKMAREVQLMLNDVLDAYIQRDAELAEQIITRDEDVDGGYQHGVLREHAPCDDLRGQRRA